MHETASRRPYRLLLVDDDAMVRTIARRMLASPELEILEAADGPSALALAAADPGEIDLLLTDVAMPTLRGQELAERLRASRPSLRVLFMSGAIGADKDERDGFVQKPFSRDSLRESVKQALSSGRAP